MLLPDGALYGTTQWGGVTGQGTVFRFDPATGEVRTLHTFTGVHEGTSPFDGLTLAGGLLYGVTNTTLFRVDPVSSATTILYTFGEGSPQIVAPSSGLTLGADGLLYGTTRSGPAPAGRGTIYRLDPATIVVTVVHEFTDLFEPEGRLLLGPDGRLFGSTLYEDTDAPVDITPGGVYRYDPATDTYEALTHYLGVGPNPSTSTAPGPLVMTPDGSIYGTTGHGDGDPSTSLLCNLFRLRPSGGGYVIEFLVHFDFSTTGLADRVRLTVGADGLLYGYASEGGSVGAGTLYRLNPAGGGPPSNPNAFTVLHQFVPTTIWRPSEPMLGADGRLYGMTSQGGAGRRGGIYALEPATGGFSHAADVPGTAAGFFPNLNSGLTLGPDNALYGTSVLVDVRRRGQRRRPVRSDDQCRDADAQHLGGDRRCVDGQVARRRSLLRPRPHGVSQGTEWGRHAGRLRALSSRHHRSPHQVDRVDGAGGRRRRTGLRRTRDERRRRLTVRSLPVLARLPCQPEHQHARRSRQLRQAI